LRQCADRHLPEVVPQLSKVGAEIRRVEDDGDGFTRCWSGLAESHRLQVCAQSLHARGDPLGRDAEDHGEGHHLRHIAISLGGIEASAVELHDVDYRIHHAGVDPQQQLRVLGAVRQARHRIGASDVRVHSSDPSRSGVGGRGVPIGHGQHVAARGSQAAEGVTAPVAVLSNAGHGERMQRLHHQ
jgi:hypothetical protein